MVEIGSEFMMGSFIRGKNEYINLIDYPKRYVLSGRTGLYLIAQELLITGINSVSLPAYCCGSMVAPFVDAGIKVAFYENFETVSTDAVLLMDYFGFLKEETTILAERYSSLGKKVIVDATQSAFSRSKAYDFADYIVVSYRKWMDCLCAAVYSKNGFRTSEYTRENISYLDTWRNASEKKKKYINFGIGNKKEFLELYAKANKILSDDYVDYIANASEVEIFENVESKFIRDNRRKNASLLIESLSGKVKLIYEDMSAEDCPLHVPVVLPSAQRFEIRMGLIKNGIYCPCHWPLDEKYPHFKTRLHDEEMSLICDQRYTEYDMKREIKEILRLFSLEER